MAQYKVSFDIEFPDEATQSEILNWFKFNLGQVSYFKPETDALEDFDIFDSGAENIKVSLAS